MPTPNLPDDDTLIEWLVVEARATKAPWESYRWMLSAKTGPHKYELMGWTANNKATRTQQSQLNCDLLAIARNHFRPLIEEVLRLRAELEIKEAEMYYCRECDSAPGEACTDTNNQNQKCKPHELRVLAMLRDQNCKKEQP